MGFSGGEVPTTTKAYSLAQVGPMVLFAAYK